MSGDDSPADKVGPLPAGWEYVASDNPIIGMPVTVERPDGTTVEGTVAGIWTRYRRPRRVDVETDDGVVNTDRDRVEVTA